MDNILIAYSTWSGTTREVAEEIAKNLEKKNLQVTVLPANQVKSLEGYESVLIGTSVHAGQTTGNFNKFLKKYHDALGAKKVAYFVVCFNMIEDNEENRIETLKWLEKSTGKYPEIKPVSIGLFAGAALIDSPEFIKQNFFVKKIIESMSKSMVTDKGKSDFRDIEKINAWAEELVEKIA
jgi:menaquinone-dependent protoporphyrinogen oxidase